MQSHRPVQTACHSQLDVIRSSFVIEFHLQANIRLRQLYNSGPSTTMRCYYKSHDVWSASKKEDQLIVWITPGLFDCIRRRRRSFRAERWAVDVWMQSNASLVFNPRVPVYAIHAVHDWTKARTEKWIGAQAYTRYAGIVRVFHQQHCQFINRTVFSEVCNCWSLITNVNVCITWLALNHQQSAVRQTARTPNIVNIRNKDSHWTIYVIVSWRKSVDSLWVASPVAIRQKYEFISCYRRCFSYIFTFLRVHNCVGICACESATCNWKMDKT
jgi:hypothetical protein